MPAGERGGFDEIAEALRVAVHEARHTDADAGHVGERDPLGRHEGLDGLDHELERLLGGREVERHVAALPHVAGEVDEDAGEVVAIEVETDGESGFGVDRQDGGRRAPLPAAAVDLMDEAGGHQLLDQVRDGLDRELGAPGDIGARERPVQTDDFQNEPQVILLSVNEIRASQHFRTLK